jgi:HSP20 family protein
MTDLPERRPRRSLLPEISELFGAFPSFAGLRPMFDSRLMRLEDDMKDDRYEIRAEIPGIDPAKDVEITVRDGRLTIKAERSERQDLNGRSEFSYGSFVRTVTLPPGADEDRITASYEKGILTVSVPISAPESAEKRIEVQSSESSDPPTGTDEE